MMKRSLITAICALAVLSCGKGSAAGGNSGTTDDGKTTGGTTVVEPPAFAKGADISWVSEMEKDGKTFKKQDGTASDILDVLKEVGINAIRLRVWVDPYGGWSGKDDVVRMAGRVTKAGLVLMVDFHYSDFFADPSRQGVPAAWAGDTGDIAKMTAHVTAHTTEVLQALKDAGVTPAWVQVGNETRNGMLWPTGQLWSVNGSAPGGWAQFVRLYMAGYNAAKAVFPDIQVMPHIDNAWDIESNDWWFKQFSANGAKFDMIALSHYPQYETNPAMTPDQVSDCALAETIALADTYHVPVIISEVGVKTPTNEDLAAQTLSYFMEKVQKLKGCAGVFYWEPEVYGGWKPAVYGDADAIYRYTGKRETWNAYGLGAFTTDGRASSVMDAFKK